MEYALNTFPIESSFKKLNFFMFSSQHNIQNFDLQQNQPYSSESPETPFRSQVF